MICNNCSTRKICTVYKAIDTAHIEINYCEFNNISNEKSKSKETLDFSKRLKKPDLKTLDNSSKNKNNFKVVTCPSCNGKCYDDSIALCDDCGKTICDNCGTSLSFGTGKTTILKHYCEECYNNH